MAGLIQDSLSQNQAGMAGLSGAAGLNAKQYIASGQLRARRMQQEWQLGGQIAGAALGGAADHGQGAGLGYRVGGEVGGELGQTFGGAPGSGREDAGERGLMLGSMLRQLRDNHHDNSGSSKPASGMTQQQLAIADDVDDFPEENR